MTVALSPSPWPIEAEQPADGPVVDALVLEVFGPGRFAKTAERLREGSTREAGFVHRIGGRLTGSVRLWPIRVGDTPALFLGPITVEPGSRSGGLGGDLVKACIDHARERAAGGILLVGDEAYFRRFGFVPAPDVQMPGPVDRRRVLWLPVTQETVSGAAIVA